MQIGVTLSNPSNTQRTGRKPALLRFIPVDQIPEKWGRKVISRSKYYPYLAHIASRRKGTKVKVLNGGLSAVVLYGHLTEVCQKAKIENLQFAIRQGELYCEVK